MQNHPLLLCLDLGTSACKGALVDAQGRAVEAARESYSLIYEPNGWIEQEPEVLWAAVGRVIAKLAAVAGARVAALGFSAQISSHLLAAADGTPLTRFISWADRRTETESRELAGAFSGEELAAAWGVRLSPGPSWPLPKLKWWRRHMPMVLDEARYLLQPKDWILGRLCGAWVSDLSSMRGLRHQESGEISPKLAEWAGFNPGIVPDVAAPDSIAGKLRSSLAREWNLPPDLPVVVGWNDLAAGVFGCTGLPECAIGFDLTGTSEHLGIVGPRFAKAGAAFALSEIPFGPGRWARYGVTSSSGRVLQWYWEQFRQEPPGSYGELEEEAAAIAPGAGGLILLPCLDGERAPWFNSHARGAFYGISAAHTPAHFSRAALEGIVFTLRSIQKRLELPGAEQQPSEFRVAGGGSAMAVWNQMKADILETPVTTLESGEAGCLGAAILAAKALGWYPSWSAAAKEMIRTARTFEPNAQLTPYYEQQHAVFEKLYSALEPLFEGQAIPG